MIWTCCGLPVSPPARFVVISKLHEGEQREGGVSQPAIPVIPVPHASQSLGKRGCGGSDHSASWGTGQSLQCDEGALDRFAPDSDVGAPIAPLPLGPAFNQESLLRSPRHIAEFASSASTTPINSFSFRSFQLFPHRAIDLRAHGLWQCLQVVPLEVW